MLPFLNPKKLQETMSQLGIKQEKIPALEVIIKCPDKQLVVKNPEVSKINFSGQEMLQVNGKIEELKEAAEEKQEQDFTEHDIEIVATKAKVSREKAKSILIKTKDITKAILELKK